MTARPDTSSEESGPVFTSVRSRTLTLVVLTFAVAGFALVAAALHRTLPHLADPAWLRTQITAFGPYAPAVFVLVQALQVVVAPVPGQVLAFVGGYLFGVVHGTAYSLLGAAIGSAVAFLLARRFGRPYVERVVTPETLAAFDGVVARDGRFAIFLVFLVPGLPDDAVCFLAGVTRIPVWQLLVISLVGRLPGYLAVSYAGTQLSQANYAATTVVLAALALVSGLVYWQKDALLDALSGR
ncbi:MAG: TVP38/TMEM64 family protein [Haloarculaceae archaeon]